MKKGYWIIACRSISDESATKAYGDLAVPALVGPARLLLQARPGLRPGDNEPPTDAVRDCGFTGRPGRLDARPRPPQSAPHPRRSPRPPPRPKARPHPPH